MKTRILWYNVLMNKCYYVPYKASLRSSVGAQHGPWRFVRHNRKFDGPAPSTTILRPLPVSLAGAQVSQLWKRIHLPPRPQGSEAFAMQRASRRTRSPAWQAGMGLNRVTPMSQLGHQGTSDVPAATRNNDLRRRPQRHERSAPCKIMTYVDDGSRRGRMSLEMSLRSAGHGTADREQSRYRF
jgi:hypothetical protein